jgi:hypothetical protein
MRGGAHGTHLAEEAGEGSLPITRNAALSQPQWGSMKYVVAIIKPFKFDAVRDALTRLGVRCM